jgi:NAD(P)-dependent dehydrogenase (short-subunit alcohol dehydrogenase family)
MENFLRVLAGGSVDTTRLFSLMGRRAFVTGGGRGIGRAIALGYADAGADVAVGARTQSEVEEVAAFVRERGRRAGAVTLDLLDPEARAAAIERVWADLGGLDVLVNNAGAAPFAASLADSHMSGWEKYLSLLITAQASLTQLVVRRWLEEDASGVVINIASIYGFRGGPFLSYYAAGKHALIGLTRSLALEVADRNVRVNALCPGWVRTTMSSSGRDEGKGHLGDVPMGRWAKPDEMAGPAIFLASDASSYMTGQTLIVDGGVLA